MDLITLIGILLVITGALMIIIGTLVAVGLILMLFEWATSLIHFKKYSKDELTLIQQQLDKFGSIDWDWEVFRGGGYKNWTRLIRKSDEFQSN